MQYITICEINVHNKSILFDEKTLFSPLTIHTASPLYKMLRTCMPYKALMGVYEVDLPSSQF